MDVVGSITSITAQVLRRLADGVDPQPVEAGPDEVHIHVHIHGDYAAPTVEHDSKFRWGKR